MDRSDFLPSARLQELAQATDPKLQLDPDAEQVLQDVADDFVENLAAFACELAVHRGGQMLEARDIQLALGAMLYKVCLAGLRVIALLFDTHHTYSVLTEKNWGMRLVGVGDSMGELKVIKKSTVTEAHKSRLADVRRSKLNAHR